MTTLSIIYDYNEDSGIDIELNHLILRPHIISINYLLNISNVLDIALPLLPRSLNVIWEKRSFSFNAVIDWKK